MNQWRTSSRTKQLFFSASLCLCGELLLSVIVLFAFTGCSSKAEPRRTAPPAAPAIKASLDVFDDFLTTDTQPADGFDFPVGSNWRMTEGFPENKATGGHTGEDWTIPGSPNAALRQPIHSIAAGRVLFADDGGKALGQTIVTEHTFYENNQKRTIRSRYVNLSELKVKQGDLVTRLQAIATVGESQERESNAHLHFDLSIDEKGSSNSFTFADNPELLNHYVAPSEFINEHRKLFIPQQESTLVLVDQASYRMPLYHSGNLHGEYNVSFGQSEGQKRTQGDNKTPKGMYFIIQKHRGNDFPGPYGGYYGKHWMKINYPNKYDAAWGRSQGVINAKQEATITASWQNRSATLENTGLGGGIGFHGWINEWDNRGPRRLSWGCVVMHISDVTQLFDKMPEGSMIVIF